MVKRGMMAGMECWATVAMDTEEAVKALVLAKGLRRFMTLRPLVLVASPTLPDDVWELLQSEFDVVVRLERRWLEAGVNPHTAAKVMVWSLSKWQRVVFLSPETMVVRGCDEIFEKSKEKNVASWDNSVMAIKPEVDVWRKLVEGLKSMGPSKKGNKADQEEKLFSQVLGQKLGRLDDKFCVGVNLKNGLMATDLNELAIVHFMADHPMEILRKDEISEVSGTLESAIMQLWKENLDRGVAQQLAKLETIHFNGLKSYLDQYRSDSPTGPDSALTTLMEYQDSQLHDVKNSVAIIGMSCRFPGANTLAEFWQLLIEGRDAICTAPEGRWTTERCPVLPDDSKNSRAGFLSCSVDDFDGKFFGVSPMELEFMDPQQRLTLQVAWEALEDAGINPVSLQRTYTGVFGGAWRTDYREALQNSGVGETEFFRSYLGNSFGVLTARISHTLGLTGPSVSTESGCSSSIVAVDLACKSLLRGETNLSLACGVNLLIHPFTGKTMNTVLAPDGHCKTFDASADGFGRAEGCGVLVLKRYSDAVKDGDRVWGLIRGSAVVQEGASRSLGTPTKYCEALAMSMALQDAGVEPKDVSFVETHGTGTPVGDPLEVAAVASVYSEGREEPLTIGSVKTNIGHTESCSGIAGIIKVVLSMQNEVIPPHKNFTSLNPSINLDAIPAQIPLEPMEWKRDPKRPRIAGVSSFGITGTDAHAIVQETPALPHPILLRSGDDNRRPVHILTISGKNEEALEDSLAQFREFLENTNEKLEDIAHTSNVGRGQFLHRAALVGKDNADLLEKFKNANTILKKVAPEEAPKICFLFTGQGSQYPSMARELYEHNLVFKMHFDQCDSLLSRDYGIEIKDALWGQNGHNLVRTIYSQTSIFCVEYCLLQLWASWGITPDYVLGHSLGEFAAAVGAGIISFADALKLVAERSRLIDALPRGKMIVLKEGKEKVDVLLKKAFEGTDRWLDFAAFNSPEQTVVAGSEENILGFAEFCKNNQIKTHVLESTHAFHSRHMDPILDEYRAVAETVNYSKPQNDTVYVSGMEGRVLDDTEGAHVNADYWVRHTRDSVRFSAAARDIMGKGCTLFLEAGPQPVLSALTMINSDGVPGLTDPVVCLPSIRKQEDDWSCILTTVGKLFLSGMSINWKQFNQFEPVQKTTIPFYSFQNKPYWFEIPDRGPGQIHPLVGTLVSNASALKLFQNQLDLEDAEFLKDHVIGNKVIFPGAGFMEMCLVAGHSATQCTDLSYFHPPGPITLTDFAIESPLGLSEVETAHLQAIVSSSEESGDTKVTIYSRLVLDKETQKWIRHASATFSPYAVQSDSKDEDGDGTLPPIAQLLEEFKYSREISETYGKLAEFGLKFGPTFQTLKKMLTKTEQSLDDSYDEDSQDDAVPPSESLFEVRVTQPPGKFVCHPVVMDALFQAVMISAHPSANKLHVPVSVGKFISFAPVPAEAETAYIYCKVDSKGEIRATLMDVEGTMLGQMEGAILMETTVGAIMSALEAQKLSLPTMYEDVWRTQFGPMERRADLLQVFNYNDVEDPEVIADWSTKFNDIPEDTKDFNRKSDRLYILYIIKGLQELGLSATLSIGSEIVVKEFATTAKVLSGLTGCIRFMFLQLERDGYFVGYNKEVRDALSFKLVKALPTPEQVAEEIDALFPVVHAMSPDEVDYVSSTGRKVANMLTGKESALPLLFPEDTSSGSAETYYMTAKMSSLAHSLLNAYMNTFLKDAIRLLEENKQTIRILEVGAGTGSFTKTLLPHLQGHPSNWEFTYTDLSPVFFAKGEKVFENSKIKVIYKTLNVEEDTATQGFFPAHYDIIIANNVIHVAKSIEATTRNLKNLLRENGILLVSEGIVPIRGTVLTFGLLEAYWNYEDHDFPLRGYSCEISLDKWKNVMESVGYAHVACYPSFDNRFALVGARNVSHGQIYKVPTGVEKTKEKKAWLVFTEDGPVSTYVQNHLRPLGNLVILIRKGEQFSRDNATEFTIRPEVESDMTQLFDSAKDAGIGLEGIIFLWGLAPFSDLGNVSPVAQPFLHICKSIIALHSPKLFVVTKSVLDIGDMDLAPPTSSPLYGMVRCFQNEVPGATARCIDLDDSVQVSEESLKEMFSEFLLDDGETYVAYRGRQRVVPRFVPWKPQNTALSFPKTERFHMVLPASNAISDLRFGPLTGKPTLKEGEVEARIRSYALNFRDVFAVLKPSVEFETMNTVGIDWSGVVTAVGPGVTKWQVGDFVFSTSLSGDALPSHTVRPETQLMPIPDSMTFNEAATIPAVAATAYLCLLEIAKLTSNDTILIHTASGGVGLVALQIAQHIGARIVATAGSKRKRAYLRNLGVKHIFHSRNTNYQTEIREVLGSGVDVVLNSLTSPGFKEASLSLCNPGGRFVEMSKLNTWTEEEVKELRPDVLYTIVDLSASTPDEQKRHTEVVAAFIQNQVIRPIPYTRFDASEIREALTYLQKARHVGKIVVTMPDPEMDGLIPMFSDRATYLITGGLGGIGMEVVKWMVGSGAKNVALVGRSKPNEKAADEIRRMNQKGKNVFALQYDVGDEDQCAELLARLQSEELDLPPLRGVMHAAGVISDAIYTNQTWEKYLTTYRPKVMGGWNLHKLTKNLRLEHFVMFSSAVASLGSLGQSNHASANFYLDTLARYRHYSGLPATTINWGQWGQVGVAANIEITGLRSFSALQGISALERVMKSQRLQACVCDADFSVVKEIFSGTIRYLEELKINQHESTRDLVINNEQFWNDYDSAKDDDSRLEVLKRFVRSMIRQILKLGKDEAMNDDENFQDLGMDSLMMIEMKNVVQSTLGKRATITVNSVKDCHTVNQLATRLVQLLSGNDIDDVPSPTREELLALMREDSILPESIRPAPLPACAPSQVKTILITGVTGNMGPYFLQELTSRPQISKIYCIIRDEKDHSASTAGRRLEKKLAGKGMSTALDWSKVTILAGHLNRSRLGLGDDEYNSLASEVDAVIHLAVKSNFTEEYKRIEKAESDDIRTVNVKGTLHVLEFVTAIKTKLLFHASTIVANNTIDTDFSMAEFWPKEHDFDDMPNSAYPISKFVCDRLMGSAVEDRGLPVKVFRFPAVGGDSATGANVDYENNQLMLRMMSYLHLGFMPALPIPFFILPVDVCVKLALRVFFDDDTPSDIYNIYNPYPHNETEIVLIGHDMGYRVEIVEPDDFQEQFAAFEDSKLIHFLKEATGNKDAQNRFLKDSPAIMSAYTRNPTHAFASKKLAKLIPEYPKGIENTLSVIRRDLEYAKNSGIFAKFGI